MTILRSALKPMTRRILVSGFWFRQSPKLCSSRTRGTASASGLWKWIWPKCR